ncbi:hypothetical protein P3X46_029046 [Hevea brasiliensis]|uniref:Uncharacterized protein n=1 Tax=Hevea brasiliensis TaxID=3981 RepID=A0ABQ9KUE7_HEVBR|nr:uncharacterized protein LOC110666397 [Hevea brasiliensis]KAJ9146822.1 hypothetical protein P3X46_029046 [Hevea brasiliensis]
MAANLLFSCNLNSIRALYSTIMVDVRPRILNLDQPTTGITCGSRKFSHRLLVVAATEGSANSTKSEESIPSWARPDSDELPPWARDEANGNANANSAKQNFEIPFFVYLLASAITAIAAIGSVFEYVNQKPAFGILNSDNIFYAPLLGFFAFTGIPTSAFLWFKSVQVANKEAEEQDRRDGYL